MDSYIKCDNICEIPRQNILQKAEAKDLKMHLRNELIKEVFAKGTYHGPNTHYQKYKKENMNHQCNSLSMPSWSL